MQLVLLEMVLHLQLLTPRGVSTKPASGFSPPPDNSLGSAGKGVRDVLNVPQESTTKNEGNKKQPVLAVSTLPA